VHYEVGVISESGALDIIDRQHVTVFVSQVCVSESSVFQSAAAMILFSIGCQLKIPLYVFKLAQLTLSDSKNSLEL